MDFWWRRKIGNNEIRRPLEDGKSLRFIHGMFTANNENIRANRWTRGRQVEMWVLRSGDLKFISMLKFKFSDLLSIIHRIYYNIWLDKPTKSRKKDSNNLCTIFKTEFGILKYIDGLLDPVAAKSTHDNCQQSLLESSDTAVRLLRKQLAPLSLWTSLNYQPWLCD